MEGQLFLLQFMLLCLKTFLLGVCVKQNKLDKLTMNTLMWFTFYNILKKICQCTETPLNKTLVVHVEQVKFLGVNMAFLATLPFTFIF